VSVSVPDLFVSSGQDGLRLKAASLQVEPFLYFWKWQIGYELNSGQIPLFWRLISVCWIKRIRLYQNQANSQLSLKCGSHVEVRIPANGWRFFGLWFRRVFRRRWMRIIELLTISQSSAFKRLAELNYWMTQGEEVEAQMKSNRIYRCICIRLVVLSGCGLSLWSSKHSNTLNWRNWTQARLTAMAKRWRNCPCYWVGTKWDPNYRPAGQTWSITNGYGTLSLFYWKAAQGSDNSQGVGPTVSNFARSG